MEQEIEHDDECGEEIRLYGECKHGPAYQTEDYGLRADDGSAQRYFVENSL